jgi:hypothetical protein
MPASAGHERLWGHPALGRTLTIANGAWYLAPLIPGFLIDTVWSAIRSTRPATLVGLALMDAVIAPVFYVVWKMNVRAARCLSVLSRLLLP